ncbi:MAG: MBL fold metallo-hydrolase [Actinomycetota bacterium]
MNDTPMAQDLGQGISLVTLPLPFRSPPSVNAYLIEGSDGHTLIDCGTDWPDGYAALVGGLGTLGLDPAAIRTLVVSHLHPDHVGMAPRLVRDWGLSVVMHARATKLVTRYNDPDDFRLRTEHLAERHGVPSGAKGPFMDVGQRPPWMPPIDPPDRVVDDHDTIPLGANRHLEVLHTPGHEPAHICLRDSRSAILFSGDHVLPRITPFVGYDELFEDVLSDFLSSLRRIERLAATITYPAHGSILEHGSARAGQILLHHQRRLSEMVEIVDWRGATAWSVMEKVFRPNLSPMDQRLALRETVAHLEHLRLTDRLRLPERDGRAIYVRP